MQIKKFEFSIGGYFGSSYSIIFADDIFKYESSGEFLLSINGSPIRLDETTEKIILNTDTTNAELIISGESVALFYNYISRYCKSWLMEYQNFDICDGTSWDCDIWIDDFRIKSNGINEYPSNFNSFLNRLSLLTGGKVFE